MNGAYILAGILFVSFVGMTCIVIDIIYNKEEKIRTRKIVKPVQKNVVINNSYNDLDINANLLDD